MLPVSSETIRGLTRFDELASAYEGWFASPLGRFVARRERDLVLRLLQPRQGERILEVGSGTGFFLRDVARTGASCAGIDPSMDMLSVAISQPMANVTHLQGCGESLPFRDASFDGLLYMTTLEFVRDGPAAVLEAARVVRPAGRLVFGVLNADGPWTRARQQEGGLWAETRFYRRAELEALLRPLGTLSYDYCVHVPPQVGWLPAPLLQAADGVLRRLLPRSGALIGVRVDLGRQP